MPEWRRPVVSTIFCRVDALLRARAACFLRETCDVLLVPPVLSLPPALFIRRYENGSIFVSQVYYSSTLTAFS